MISKIFSKIFLSTALLGYSAFAGAQVARAGDWNATLATLPPFTVSEAGVDTSANLCGFALNERAQECDALTRGWASHLVQHDFTDAQYQDCFQIARRCQEAHDRVLEQCSFSEKAAPASHHSDCTLSCEMTVPHFEAFMTRTMLDLLRKDRQAAIHSLSRLRILISEQDAHCEIR